jgi:hypothetical protein
MTLSPEFEGFYSSWIHKATFSKGDDLRGLFDKFFTFFVIYNRLYAEATFVLGRKGEIDLSKRTSFPDGEAAKTYVLKYLGSSCLMDRIAASSEATSAIETMRGLLKDGVFHIKLNMVTGDPQPAKDAALLKDLESRSTNARAKAILDLLYSIRCNMFHGHKGFHQVQIKLLLPVVILLRVVIETLHAKLQHE